MAEPDQLGLFDEPAREVRPAPAGPRPVKATYTKYRSLTRRLCDDCTADIHTRGVIEAPLPNVARWVRKTAFHSQRLCTAHKEARVLEENR